jgi:hypothetical protein
MVHRSPTTDKVRASEHVIVSICFQRILRNFRTTLDTILDSKLEVGSRFDSKMEVTGLLEAVRRSNSIRH